MESLGCLVKNTDQVNKRHVQGFVMKTSKLPKSSLASYLKKMLFLRMNLSKCFFTESCENGSM